MPAAQITTQTKEAGHGAGLFIALAPWVLFTFIARHGTLQIASIAALVAVLAIAVPGLRAGRPKTLEVGAIAAFAAFALVAFAGDAALAAWVERYARGIAAALLALIAFGSLAFVPFPEQYARDEVPQAHWGSPVFKTVNRRLTLLWGTVFAAMVPFHVLAGALDTQRANLLFNWVVPVALVLWALKRTSALADGEVTR
jgi:hypothetical protein